jgi:hypothetical protein
MIECVVIDVALQYLRVRLNVRWTPIENKYPYCKTCCLEGITDCTGTCESEYVHNEAHSRDKKKHNRSQHAAANTTDKQEEVKDHRNKISRIP